jgi:endonuclease G
MDESFLLTNITPQLPGLNRYGWAELEAWVRDCAISEGELYVVTGPIYDATPQYIGNYIEVADAFYKVLLQPVTGEMAAFIVPHQDIYASDLPGFTTTVDAVEAVTGLDFFSGLRDEIEVIAEAETTTICPLSFSR